MKKLFTLVVLGLALAWGVDVQSKSKTTPTEQMKFGLEQRVHRPVVIPGDVLTILRQKSDLQTCNVEGGSRDKVPETWYEASQIHLDGTNEADLLVKARIACMMGPNHGPFWVFRETVDGHSLVLSTLAAGLQILNTKTNGLRDIRTGALVGLKPSYVTYQFDGHAYQPNEHRDKP